MSRIFRYLYPRFHEVFSDDIEIDLVAGEELELKLQQERYSCPGFWYTVDINDNVVRTNCAENVYKSFTKFIKWDNEVKIRILTSYWDGDDGFRSMKDYKQCFRRVMKHLPKDTTTDLNDAFGSCYTFELMNLWNEK